MNRTFQRYAERRAGTHNKFYEVVVTEQDNGLGLVTYRWGRIGSTGQKKEELFPSFESAKSGANDKIESKIMKGYREVTAMEVLAAAFEDVSERKSNGLPPVEMPELFFDAGPSEKRCQDLCKGYLAKFNLILTSFYDLGPEDYRLQMKSLRHSLGQAWRRLRMSKTHGRNVTHASHATFDAFTAFLDKQSVVAYSKVYQPRSNEQ